MKIEIEEFMRPLAVNEKRVYKVRLKSDERVIKEKELHAEEIQNFVEEQL